jgi:transcriptional regulator with XRE-family HTH domain
MYQSKVAAAVFQKRLYIIFVYYNKQFVIIYKVLYIAPKSSMLPERQIKYLYEELGARIKKGRLALGYKQAAFASLLKISRASLVNIEQGRQHAPLHNLYEIARLLKMPLTDLLPPLIDNEVFDFDTSFQKEIEMMSKGNSEIQKKLKEFILIHNHRKPNE